MEQNANHAALEYMHQNIRIFCMGSGVPCISVATETFLTKLLQEHQPHSYLEIGSACGYSLFTVALQLQQWGGVALGCERAYPNTTTIEQNKALAKQYGLSNYEYIFGPFLKLAPALFTQYAPFDFVLIDAQKAEYPLYLQYIIENKLIHDKTIVLFDDVIKYKDRMQELETTLTKHGFTYQVNQLDEDDGILLAYY